MKGRRKWSFWGKWFVRGRGMERYWSEGCEGEGKGGRVMEKKKVLKVGEGLMEIEDEEYVRFWKGGMVMGCWGE